MVPKETKVKRRQGTESVRQNKVSAFSGAGSKASRERQVSHLAADRQTLKREQSHEIKRLTGAARVWASGRQRKMGKGSLTVPRLQPEGKEEEALGVYSTVEQLQTMYYIFTF